MTIGSVGASALQPLPSMNSTSGASKAPVSVPTATGHAPAAALVKENEAEKENTGVGKQVNVLA
ncbi:hypothetical protein [Frigoriglobus tundricola]|uniref:Uncharacterized protein n=1 Tax=Frigoriglobus tundricola TaxID=2774151 RepID=A0A6M5Z2Z9_9BACT|nr:hypothetical protein [Frigoriglobus tundricola]QJX00107.1 hypothetical protein FTUN_7731 [Frigoriglobus tundricola]